MFICINSKSVFAVVVIVYQYIVHKCFPVTIPTMTPLIIHLN